MNRIRLRATGALAAALVAGSALAGCGMVREAGAAAIVGGNPIPLSRLQALTGELVEMGADVDPQTRQPLPAGEAQRRTLEKLIASRVLAEAAERQRIVVTAGDVDARYAEFVEVAGGEEAVRQGLALARNVPPSYARQYVRDLLISERLATELVPGAADDPEVLTARQQALSELLVEVGADLGVTVNPRYGAWEAGSGAVTGLVSGGLARALDEAPPALDEAPPSPPGDQ